MDKDEKKEWIEIRQRHLIEGSLIRVDQYVNEMLDVLL
jgi:small nuclear ribonucleoprotein (snRNP)-like protein